MLSIRSEFLTPIFKSCVFLTSPYLYILVISLGFWLNRKSSLWMSLAFLVPFTTVLNSILKSIFNIPRPSEFFWLVTPSDALGFPSGEVQVATVFLLLVALNFENVLLRISSYILLVCIAFSRVYLGVHSVFDVGMALAVGLLTVLLWNLPNTQRCVNRWWSGGALMPLLISILLTSLLWGLVVLQQFALAQSTLKSLGVLLGFSVSLLGQKNRLNTPQLNTLFVFGVVLSALISMGSLILIPSYSVPLVVVKYAVLALIIFYFSPRLISRYFIIDK